MFEKWNTSYKQYMGLLPNTSNCGCACAGNAGNVFPATPGKQTRHASRHVRGARAVMHAGIAKSRLLLNSVAGENVPGIPSNFTYLVRGPCSSRYWVMIENGIGRVRDRSMRSLSYVHTCAIVCKIDISSEISNHTRHATVGCNYLSMPKTPVCICTHCCATIIMCAEHLATWHQSICKQSINWCSLWNTWPKSPTENHCAKMKSLL